MLPIAEIEDDLAGGSIDGLERTFRALVGYPQDEEIEGASDGDRLTAMFRRVCAALRTDNNQLPRATMQILVAAKTADHDAPLSTYSTTVMIGRMEHDPRRNTGV